MFRLNNVEIVRAEATFLVAGSSGCHRYFLFGVGIHFNLDLAGPNAWSGFFPGGGGNDFEAIGLELGLRGSNGAGAVGEDQLDIEDKFFAWFAGFFGTFGGELEMAG